MSQDPSFSLAARQHVGFLIKCWILVLFVRIILTVKSYKPILKSITTLKGTDENYRHPLLFAWGVKSVARYVPKASCLTQALSLRWLMARAGKNCTVCVGVAPGESKQMKAHAWVIYRDTVILGGDEKNFSTFTPITEL